MLPNPRVSRIGTVMPSRCLRLKEQNLTGLSLNLQYECGMVVTPCGQTDVLVHHKKTFLAFSRTSKRRHWSKISTKKFFFGFIQRKISFSGENIFSLGTLSAIIYHIKPGFHIVVSVVSVVRKKFIGPTEFILSHTTSCICHFFCIEHLYGRFP